MEIMSRWIEALAGILNQAMERFASCVPNVLGALPLLLTGWLVAHLLRIDATRVAQLEQRTL